MIRHYPYGWPQRALTLLAVVVIALLPVGAEAAGLAFRNETDSPILIQGISIINRVARRGKLHVVRPGEVSQELIVVPGTILVTVADAKQPTRILCQEKILFTGTDLFFAVKAQEPEKTQDGDNVSARAKEPKVLTPKVKLVLSKPIPPVSPPPRR